MLHLPVYQLGERAGSTLVDLHVAQQVIGGSALRLTDGGYVRCRGHRLHRLILGVPTGHPDMVDHIDGNTLNNLISNLRRVSNAQNSQNQRKHRPASSKHRGVTFHRATGRWEARVRLDYGRIDMHELFDTEEEAAAAALRWRTEVMPFSIESSA